MNTGRDSGICKYVGKREKEEKNINFLIILNSATLLQI